MEWRPKRWLATLLSLLFPPLGMLYVQRPRLALVYLLASLILQSATIVGVVLLGGSAKAAVALAGVGVNVVAAIHAFRIAGAAALTTERHWYSRWYGLISTYAMYGLFALLFRSFLFEPFNLPSDSMYPTLTGGSFIIVKKWGYGDYQSLGVRLLDTEPRVPVSRGELLLFRLPNDPETVYLKRVVGLPGDRIQCLPERLIINGAAVPSGSANPRGAFVLANETLDSVTYTVARLPSRPASRCDLVVPEGHYFMLGDSRDNSRDSRYIGPVPSGNLVGRVAFAIRAADSYGESEGE
ncbi:signal peptidase I [Peristeroidobacter agariperforans]|uniref:signal peptidase I n=1 Tax=Peristeroidobacter agariperforans TaxID=268404 RepID=UPI00101C3726|nr:signal peptidase I [Peristeroidobacter agariperforans]